MRLCDEHRHVKGGRKDGVKCAGEGGNERDLCSSWGTRDSQAAVVGEAADLGPECCHHSGPGPASEHPSPAAHTLRQARPPFPTAEPFPSPAGQVEVAAAGDHQGGLERNGLPGMALGDTRGAAGWTRPAVERHGGRADGGGRTPQCGAALGCLYSLPSARPAAVYGDGARAGRSQATLAFVSASLRMRCLSVITS